MKTSAFLFYFLSIISFYSCGSSSTSSSSYVNPHKEAHMNMHQEQMAKETFKLMKENLVKEISGVYLGHLPCADCEQINFQLQLNKDYTYKSTITYQGKSSTSFENAGNYIITADQLIELDGQSGNMNLFKRSSNGLLMLDKNGHEIKGDLADHYFLSPLRTY